MDSCDDRTNVSPYIKFVDDGWLGPLQYRYLQFKDGFNVNFSATLGQPSLIAMNETYSNATDELGLHNIATLIKIIDQNFNDYQ